MPENADILFANEAFYLAFQTKDMRAMEVLWAHRQPVACTHPGWPSLSGREQVMQSWAAILANPETRGIEMRGARAYRCGGQRHRRLPCRRGAEVVAGHRRLPREIGRAHV